MIEIGHKPILWHIMKLYSAHGINDFIVCCGYKGYVIKEYFANYFLHQSDVTFCMKENRMDVHQKRVEPWAITLVDTGDSTQTGGRLKRVSEYLKGEGDFCFTYGDGVGDIDVSAVISFHQKHGLQATMTTVYPPGRFGAVNVEGDLITSFKEKPKGDGGLINGGFFVLSPDVIDLIEDDKTIWEDEPLQVLAANQQLKAYTHEGFWQPMDTLRDKNHLEELWKSGNAPWKVWK